MTRTVGTVVDAHGKWIVAATVVLHTALVLALLAANVAHTVAWVWLSGVLGFTVCLWVTVVQMGAHVAGCCRACDGAGAGGTARVESHGGLCWDCRGTGHPHVRRWWHR